MTNIPDELKAPEAVAQRTRAYYQMISAKGKEVIREKKADGETMHLAPLGWLNARDERGRSIIVPDPERYGLVQEAKQLRKGGMSSGLGFFSCFETEEMGARDSRPGQQTKTSAHLKLGTIILRE